MIDFVKVGAKITKYRKELNLTQDDIASRLFVSRQLISKWENGTGVPSIDVLVELCRLFQIGFEELLCLNDEVEISDDNIFKGKNRLYVVQSIIDGVIKINLSDVFYQFSPIERMRLLRAIKEERLEVNLEDLYPKLTVNEQKFLRKVD